MLMQNLDLTENIQRNSKLDHFLSDCNGTRTYNHLVRKRALNDLAELA